MRIAVTGSIATDHLMTFPGRFIDSFVAGKLDKLSVSFLVDDLEVRRGGVGPNIAFGLGQLGVRSVLVGAAGADFADYRAWLEAHGVDCSGVLVSDEHSTARFTCTTDADQNQIATFYAGAMSVARTIDLAALVDRLGGLDLVLVAPDDNEAMLRHTRACRALGLPFAADPSQQLPRLDAAAVGELVEGAAYLFSNEYESELIAAKTGWSADDVLSRVGVRVTTLGAGGVSLTARGAAEIRVAAARDVTPVDPTGGGDAFRGGFLAGLSWGLGHESAAQVGCVLAAYVLESVGTQEYDVTPASLLERLTASYGSAAADEVMPHLPVAATV